jgi:hypothetical protein
MRSIGERAQTISLIKDQHTSINTNNSIIEVVVSILIMQRIVQTNIVLGNLHPFCSQPFVLLVVQLSLQYSLQSIERY